MPGEGQAYILAAMRRLPLAESSLRLPAGLGLWLATLAGFAAMASLAAAFDRFPGDLWLARRWIEVDPPVLDGAMRFVTWIGKPWPLAVISLAAAGVAAWMRRPVEALELLLTFPARGVGQVVKALVDRPRPDDSLVRVISDGATGSGFPSGHVVSAVIVYGVLWVAVGRALPPVPRWLVRTWCAFIIVATGPSRVYLGAHWPSDVAGGLLLGAALLAAILWAGSSLARWTEPLVTGRTERV